MADDSKPQIDFSALIPRLTEEVAADLRKRAVERFQYAAQEAVAGEVQRYLKENVVPHIAKELEAADAEIRAAVVAGVKASAALVAEAIVAHTKTKLVGYEGDKLLAQIFGPILGRSY